PRPLSPAPPRPRPSPESAPVPPSSPLSGTSSHVRGSRSGSVRRVPRFTPEQVRRRQIVAGALALMLLVVIGGCTASVIGALRGKADEPAPLSAPAPFVADNAAMAVSGTSSHVRGSRSGSVRRVPRFAPEQVRRRQIVAGALALMLLVVIGGCTASVIGALRGKADEPAPLSAPAPFVADNAAMAVAAP